MYQPAITITLTNAGKKFGKEWIFRRLDLELKQGETLVILGLNGSGKSTLLQAMTGFLTLNEGKLSYTHDSVAVDEHQQYKHISLASPYLDLVDEFTLDEMIAHASVYKPYVNNLPAEQVLELSGLTAHRNKAIKLFSSGMKQRLKLTLAILADTPVLFLDEPTTNLDASVIDWYGRMIDTYTAGRTIVVASNSIEHEYAFCRRQLRMNEIKPAL